MDYIINYTKFAIRCIDGIVPEDIYDFVNDQGWSRNDDYNILCIQTDEDETYKYIVSLINEYLFEIPDDQHPGFTLEQELMSHHYDAYLETPEYNHVTEVIWGEVENGWDD